MFVTISKILEPFSNPISLVLIFLALAFFLRRRRWSRWLAVAAFVILLALGSRGVSNFLVGSIEQQYPDRGLDAIPQAGAIVVLGGAIHGPGGQHRGSRLVESSDRLLVAFRLYRAHKAPVVVCSGGNVRFVSSPGDIPEAEVMSGLLQEWGVPADAMLVENGSENTRQNATLSYQILNAKGIRRILLVTSAMHMPRAAAVFRKAGFEVIPAPADFHSGWNEPSPLTWVPNAAYIARSEDALHEWVGLWVYRAMGWA